MSYKNTDIKEAILEAALPCVAFDGWNKAVLENAALSCGYSKSMVRAVFPDAEKDAIVYFSSWVDQKMLDRLMILSPQPMRVRDKVVEAVWQRMCALSTYKEAERLAVAYWMRPFRKWAGAKLVWKTADRIWDWAGDTATDYNHYTKRALLSAVITATTLHWLNDTSLEHHDTRAFLERRIENVMALGKVARRQKTA